jgi:carbon-monoxide dehydrogenase small subunit
VSEPVDIRLSANGETVARRVSTRLSVTDFLREELGLTGTHAGCEHGVCGACAVRVDGVAVRGCLMLAAQLDGAVVETLEGMTKSGELAALQAAFLERNAVQCGFCASGMLITAAELVATRPGATRDEIRDFMSGNYCRCTGYHAIIDAIETVCRERALSESPPPLAGEGGRGT